MDVDRVPEASIGYLHVNGWSNSELTKSLDLTQVSFISIEANKLCILLVHAN